MPNKPEQRLVRFDWAMKNILRNKANFDILEGFLTCLLNEEIKIEELISEESNKDSREQKINRVDLKCRDSQGRHMIVEIQSERQIDYFERIIWGASKALVESLKEGDEYLEIAKVVSINILYHNLYYPDLNKDYIYEGRTDIIGRHSKAKLVMNKRYPNCPVTSGEIFPEYYVICVNNFDENVSDAIDEWVYMFKKERVEESFDAPGIDKAAKKLGYLQMTSDERARYDRYMEAARYEFSVTDTARMEGECKGRAEGITEGISIGEQRGKLESKLETARKMLERGFDVKTISEMTELSEAEILALKKNVNKTWRNQHFVQKTS